MHEPNQPDWGDFLKTCAVLCVMLQTVLSFVMKIGPSSFAQWQIAEIYAAVKFTAPAFICGILYTTIRILPHNTWRDYPHYMANQWHALYLPTILWTLAYLIIYPQLQQHRHFHSVRGFLLKLINGNAAPHLWYSTMMLQFIALMPFFWALAHWMGAQRGRGWLALALSAIFEFGWFLVYDTQVFHGPEFHSLYWFDRIFPSFIYYGVLGVSLWVYHKSVAKWLPRLLPLIFVGWLYLWLLLAHQLRSWGEPINFANLPYYHPVVMVYNSLGILMICGIAEILIRNSSILARGAHWIAVYAFRSFLPHAFWLETLWLLLGNHVHQMRTETLLIFLYPTTVVLAFLSAYFFHVLRLVITKRHVLFGRH